MQWEVHWKAKNATTLCICIMYTNTHLKLLLITNKKGSTTTNDTNSILDGQKDSTERDGHEPE